VVTFNSAIGDLESAFSSFTDSYDLIICDNSTDPNAIDGIKSFANSKNAHYMFMGDNKGIAFAQNRGIEYALMQGYTHILLMDDDSQISAEAANDLLNSLVEHSSQGIKVGALSGRAINTKGVDLSNVTTRTGQGYTPCSLLTSSGALIPSSAFREVGLMEEGLFIDLVDFDWGWRAQHLGFLLLLDDKVTFVHSLGNGQCSLLGLKVGIPNPFRHYYQMRNSIQLLSRTYVPFAWKIKQLALIPAKFLFCSTCLPPRIQRFRFMLLGIMDALRGRTGGLNGKTHIHH
jgi:rhamnosyltransferase